MRIPAFALALSALAIPAAAPTQVVQPPRITITVDSFSFAPVPIHLAANQTVEMIFVNKANSSHDFSAPDFFAKATIRGGSAKGGKIALPAHATRAILLAPAAGTYKAWCSHFLHTSFGMKDTIVVD